MQTRPGDIHIERPDEIDGSELVYCYISPDRECRGDCVAYDPNNEPPRTRCLIINAAASQAASLASIRKLLVRPESVPGVNIPPPEVKP